ncbi:mCG1044336 [Mus musculus]|nr:mCG1044336 [Mus musculus]
MAKSEIKKSRGHYCASDGDMRTRRACWPASLAQSVSSRFHCACGLQELCTPTDIKIKFR